MGEEDFANRDYVIPGVDADDPQPYKWHTGRKRDHGGEDAIEIIDLVKQFGRARILNGLNLGLPEGQVSMVLGPSGTGKSVLIKHIVGLLEPDEGTVYVDDLEVPRLKRRELYDLRARIGYVFQFAALFDSLTIGENVAMGLRKQNTLSAREIDERVEDVLELVDLPGVTQRYPAELSGGMRKRVGIARAVSLRPKYLLYDEPTTGLDPFTSSVIRAVSSCCR